jgi:hypothetical protein
VHVIYTNLINLGQESPNMFIFCFRITTRELKEIWDLETPRVRHIVKKLRVGLLVSLSTTLRLQPKLPKGPSNLLPHIFRHPWVSPPPPTTVGMTKDLVN